MSFRQAVLAYLKSVKGADFAISEAVLPPLTPPGVDITNTSIRIWIHDRDLASLEKVLWEGEGYTLIKHTSGHPKIRKFLDAVPRLMVSAITQPRRNPVFS